MEEIAYSRAIGMNPDANPNISQQAPAQAPLQPPVVQKGIKHNKIIFSVVLICVVLLVALLVVFLSKPHQSVMKQTQAVIPSIHPTLQKPTAAQKENSEVTKETKIASSLEVPPLYPQAQWQNDPTASHDASLNRIAVSTKRISLKGNYWTATVASVSSSTVETYYFNELEKRGWFGSGGSGSLYFADFTLTPSVAGGPCGGINGYLGYKDGFVRLVTVLGQITPCKPQGLDGATTSTDYTVFISDPMPLKDITASLTSH